MYHNIAIPHHEGSLRSLYVTPRMFRFQMWYLKVAGFKIVTLNEILSFINGEIADDKLIALTFDDGYQDFYENAYPVLREYGYPSTVFLVSDLIGKENLWDYQERGIRKRLLAWERIIEMKNRGVVFGSHSKTHPFLSKLSDAEIAHEVKGSKDAIEERLDMPVEFFCYPSGDYDERVVNAVKQAGFLGAVTTKRGLAHRGDDPLEIRRSFIRLNTHPLLFMYKLHSNYEDRKR